MALCWSVPSHPAPWPLLTGQDLGLPPTLSGCLSPALGQSENIPLPSQTHGGFSLTELSPLQDHTEPSQRPGSSPYYLGFTTEGPPQTQVKGPALGYTACAWTSLLPGLLHKSWALTPSTPSTTRPLVAILGRWRQLCPAAYLSLCRAENGAETGAWCGVTRAPGRGTGSRGEPAGAPGLPKGPGGVGGA